MKAFFLFLLTTLRLAAADSAPPLMLPLWETQPAPPPPGLVANPPPESMDDAGTVSNVTLPVIAVHLPPRAKANGMALIVCPGGSYSKIGDFPTGGGAVDEFVPRGFAVIVLKYRTSPPVREMFKAALADAQRAVRLVRHHAREWNLDPQRVGMIGGSAGGHLVLNLATHGDDGNTNAADPVEKQSCRANFLALIVPWPAKQAVSAFPIVKTTPPMFIAAARDDQIAPVSFAEDLARTCEQASVKSRLWIIPEGGHTAFRLGTKGKGAGWGTQFANWLKETKLDQATARAQAGAELVSLTKIWDAGAHNAFTDLLRFENKWYCTFREAGGHNGGNGAIRIITSDDGDKWESTALITEGGIDLRDPKLSVTPEHKLMLLAGGSVFEVASVSKGRRKLLGMQPRVAFSADGKTWTPTRRIMDEGDWLWRVTWHKGLAYGISYGPGSKRKLVKSADGVIYELLTELRGDVGEATVRFLEDDSMLALARTGKNALIGTAAAPYTNWEWKDYGYEVGGPNFIQTPDGKFWAAGRDYIDGVDTVVARMTRDQYEPVLHLPSGPDCSYPGMVYHEGLLWMSYYSSHEGKQARIYLAKIKLRN